MFTFSPLPLARALALLGAAVFALCFLWGFLLSDPVLQEFHFNSLRIYLLDAPFVGANVWTLMVGMVVSAVWGAIAGLALVFCLRHCGGQSSSTPR